MKQEKQNEQKLFSKKESVGRVNLKDVQRYVGGES